MVAGILLLAAGLRLYRLESESLWYDEVVSVRALDAPGLAEFLNDERVLDPAVVPAYFCLEYFWWHYVANSEYSLRLLSTFLGLLTVGAVWWMGRVMFSPGAGLIAAFLTACSQILIYQSQEIRMYALMYLLAALSMLFLERALATGQPRWWIAHWASNGLLVWTHLFGTLVLLAQGLALLWIWRRRYRAVAAWVMAQGAYLAPLGWYLLRMPQVSLEKHLRWIPMPPFPAVLDTFWTVLPGVALDGGKQIQLTTMPSLLSHATGFLVWLCAGWLVWRRVRSKHDGARGTLPERFRKAPVLLLVLWLAAPVLTLVALSYAVQPCFVERYAGHCALPLFLLAGAGVSAINRRWVKRGVVVLLALLYIPAIAQWPRPLRPNLRGALAVIERDSVGGETFVLDNIYESGLAFAFYANVPVEDLTMGQKYLRHAKREVISGHPIWILSVGGDRGIERFQNARQQLGVKTNYYRFNGRRSVHLIHAVPRHGKGTEEDRGSLATE